MSGFNFDKATACEVETEIDRQIGVARSLCHAIALIARGEAWKEGGRTIDEAIYAMEAAAESADAALEESRKLADELDFRRQRPRAA